MQTSKKLKLFEPAKDKDFIKEAGDKIYNVISVFQPTANNTNTTNIVEPTYIYHEAFRFIVNCLRKLKTDLSSNTLISESGAGIKVIDYIKSRYLNNDINTLLGHNLTLLHWFTAIYAHEAIAYLLDKGASIDSSDYPFSPLYIWTLSTAYKSMSRQDELENLASIIIEFDMHYSKPGTDINLRTLNLIKGEKEFFILDLIDEHPRSKKLLDAYQTNLAEMLQDMGQAFYLPSNKN